MTDRTYMRTVLLLALVCMAAGGLVLHLRIHHPDQNSSNVVPLVCGILSVAAVPLLFSFRRTISYGYVLNGMLVILGTVAMAHSSIANWEGPFHISDLLFKTTLCDILLLWGKLFVGKALFDLEISGYDPARPKRGISWRYPNLGWWFVHLFAISLIYYLGNRLWR